MTAQQPHPSERPLDHAQQPDPAVLALIRQPYVAEILAVLDEQPHDLAGLRGAIGAPRKLAVSALRALAAHRAIIRQASVGSWDAADNSQVRYQLTADGRALVDYLFRLDVWRAAFEPGARSD
jgi:DNA-binding HxlR family transcriptional regulator